MNRIIQDWGVDTGCDNRVGAIKLQFWLSWKSSSMSWQDNITGKLKWMSPLERPLLWLSGVFGPKPMRWRIQCYPGMFYAIGDLSVSVILQLDIWSHTWQVWAHAWHVQSWVLKPPFPEGFNSPCYSYQGQWPTLVHLSHYQFCRVNGEDECNSYCCTRGGLDTDIKELPLGLMVQVWLTVEGSDLPSSEWQG